jgi:formate dehydrogenase major subunit
LERGITKVTALERCGDSIFAMLIDGENTLVSDPDRVHGEHALRALDHLVVIDIFLTETAALADVVLPATAWGETDGNFTNSERRIQRVRQAVTPQGEAKPDWWIISAIANRMGIPGFEYESPKEVFNELCSLSPIYAGIDWDLAEHGEYQWPIPYRGHPGSPPADVCKPITRARRRVVPRGLNILCRKKRWKSIQRMLWSGAWKMVVGHG